MKSIPLFVTGEHSCNYLDGRCARSVFVHPAFRMTSAIYGELLKHGFRRSGNDVYAPQCRQCSDCIPVRIPVARFKPNRSQQRCLKKNADVTAIVKPAVFETAHYDLYRRYQHRRHPEGSMALATQEEYIGFLASDWCETVFVEFSLGDELIAVAVVDRLRDAWSAVYTFFDPRYSNFSPGSYAILWEIEGARSQQREFLYLGYWIDQCRKMAYKRNYQPLQAFIGQQWCDFAETPSGVRVG